MYNAPPVPGSTSLTLLQKLILVAILAVAMWLRLAGVGVGLPYRVWVDEPALTRLARLVMDAEGVEESEISLLLVDRSVMTDLNERYMGEDRPTDVLAFPLHEWSIDGRHSHLADDDGVSPPGATLLGDVVLDVDQAVRQASAGDWSVPEEMVLLAIHGTLHLLGHDHERARQARAMEALEVEILRGFGFDDPYLRVTRGRV